MNAIPSVFLETQVNGVAAAYFELLVRCLGASAVFRAIAAPVLNGLCCRQELVVAGKSGERH